MSVFLYFSSSHSKIGKISQKKKCKSGKKKKQVDPELSFLKAPQFFTNRTYNTVLGPQLEKQE